MATGYRLFKLEHVQRVERGYSKFGIFALAIPAMLPPPMPFKIFVATAGALQFPRRRFLLTILIARSLRYYTEGVLAVFYGERVLRFLRDNGLIIVTIVGGICLLALVIYLISNKGRAAVRTEKERSAPSEIEKE